jgi:hypothetical protein
VRVKSGAATQACPDGGRACPEERRGCALNAGSNKRLTLATSPSAEGFRQECPCCRTTAAEPAYITCTVTVTVTGWMPGTMAAILIG